MRVTLNQFNVGKSRRFMAYSEAGDVLRSQPTNGWATEAGARRWCQKNGHTVISVERIKDSVDSIREKYCADKRQTGQLGVFGGKGMSAKAYGNLTPSTANNPEMVNKSFLRQATKNGNFEFENFKSNTEAMVADLNNALAKHITKFSGDKPMMAAIKNVRTAISTLTKFAQQRRNMMYKTKLDMF